MINNFKSPLTEQEQDIDNAMDDLGSAFEDAKWFTQAGFITNFVGFVLIIFGPIEHWIARAGFAMMMVGLLCILIGALMGIFRVRRRKRELDELVLPYMREKAMPFYSEMQEKFADEPDVHLRLEDNGMVTIIDRRKIKED